jgi:hypothetical protein
MNHTTKSEATLKESPRHLLSTRLSSQSIPNINCDRSTEQINADQSQSEAWQLHQAVEDF